MGELGPGGTREESVRRLVPRYASDGGNDGTVSGHVRRGWAEMGEERDSVTRHEWTFSLGA